MALVVQSFGRENEYKRAILLIVSYYASATDPLGTILFTDNPAYFESYLNTFPVKYMLLTPERIKEMRGEIDFLHRMKIAIIDEAFRLNSEPVLYADSDTFFISDPTVLALQLSEKKSFMHLLEYRFDTLKEVKLPAGKTFHAFHDLITTSTFTGSDGSAIPVSPLLYSWNAGVMFFHSSHARLLPDVYALTDQFYPPTHHHASEQYAFSVVLQDKTEIQPCDSVNYHYWYRVKKKIVDHFLETRLNESWTLLNSDKKISIVKKWIAVLPAMLENHVWMVRDNAIQAFNENQFRTGYQFVFLALLKNPFDVTFFKDVLYHTSRLLRNE